MRKWLNNYFSFSKSEYNGLLVMVGLVALIRATPSFYAMLFPEPDTLHLELAAIRKLSLVEVERKEMAWHKHTRSVVRTSGPLFRFDPNHAPAKDWQLLGLSEKQAAVMVRYVSKGGRFRKKEDLQKMYPITATMYQKLEPYITIKDTAVVNYKYAEHKFVPRKSIVVSLNTADTLTLDLVKGIGPAFARRIVKYRERLGGFFRKEQLLEVYGMDSIKYAEIKDQINIEGGALRLINVNTAEYADLKDNPYLRSKQINAIIQYRKQHGNYGNIADLKKVLILSAETVEKLAPYLSFDHD